MDAKRAFSSQTVLLQNYFLVIFLPLKILPSSDFRVVYRKSFEIRTIWRRKKQIRLNLFKERLNKSSTYLKFECPKMFFVINNLDSDIELPLPFAVVGQLLNISHQVVLGK